MFPAFFAVLNAVMAGLAFFVMIRSAHRTRGRVRAVFTFTAGIALFYATAYVFLAMNVEHELVLSRWIRRMGPIAWILPWIVIPEMLLNEIRRKVREIERHIREVAAEARAERKDY